MSNYMSLFVSYSSKDKDFVESKISLKLISKGIDVFWDVLSLRIGEKWENALYEELELRQGLVIIISENALRSEWVAKEYNYFRSNGKPVFACYLDDPNVLRENDELRKTMEDWNLAEWQAARIHTPQNYEKEFPKLLNNIYEASKPFYPQEEDSSVELSDITLNDIKDKLSSLGLLEAVAGGIALLLIGLPVGWIAMIVGAIAWFRGKPKPKFNMQETLLPANPTDVELYNAGLKAKLNGNLDSASEMWKGLLERSPNFHNGVLQRDYDLLRSDLKPIEVQRLENAAYDAATVANWLHAITLWEEIIQESPQHPNAQQELNVAQTNAMYSNLYENARRLYHEGGTESQELAREELRRLYEQAPYYGDPDHIAKDVGMGEKVLYAQRKLNIVNSIESVNQTINRKKQELDQTKQKLKSFKDEVSIQTKATKIYPASAFSLMACGILTCGSFLSIPLMSFYQNDIAMSRAIFWLVIVIAIVGGYIYMRQQNNKKNTAIFQLNALEKKVEEKNRQRFLLEEEIKTLLQQQKQLQKQQKDVKSFGSSGIIQGNLNKIKGFLGRNS